MFEIYDGRKKFYQWDSEEKLIVDELEIGNLVHFANCSHPESLTVKIKELDGHLVCDVPNILLQSAEDICVYAYVKDDKGNRTIFDRTIAVQRKKKPTDYVYTETEVISYDALEKRIVDIEKNGAGSNITVDDALNEESENPVQNKVVAKQFQDIDEKIGVINLHKVTTVATLSSGRSSAFVYQLDKRISGLFKVPNLPPMYWYIYDETGTRINYYSFGACPTKIDLKDNDTTVTAIVYFVTGRVIKVMYSIADNTFTAEVFEYSKYDIDQLINAKQNATDETLKTNDKTIVGAINEINGKIPTVQDVLNALPTWQGGAY